MRIAQFTSSLIEPLGGAEQYCLAVARQQLRDGHEVTLLTGWIDEPLRLALEGEGFGVTQLVTQRPYTPDGRGGSLPAKLNFHTRELVDSVRTTPASRALEAGRFDVVHVHRFAGFGTSVLRAQGVRTVHTAHDYSLVNTSPPRVLTDGTHARPGAAQSLRRRLILHGLGHNLTVVFPSMRTFDEHLVLGFRAPGVRTVFLPHGWPSPSQPAAEVTRDDEAAAPQRPVRFLFLGKLAEHKGVSLLLQAWGDGIAGAELRIAGDGPLMAEVAKAAAAAPDGTPASITALGWLNEAERTRELAEADALVFPSLWAENFPIVVAESLLLARPVISTRVASPPLVEEGESGLLVDETPAAFRAALTTFTADPQLRDRLSRGAAERAGQLDMTAHAEALYRLYRSESDGSGQPDSGSGQP